ncbi:MAG: UvrD-helicase domain-containing protein, partial [Vallitaleaceae bacterium]|nr:UvrD-helicase domain-containing protein [Vallitaleaceae bacterium]
MAFFYTNEQRKVIDTKKADVLVSAAAGSGKTAVLVERILRILTEIETPVSLDELLIVTFTNLAATEMRERIQKAIEERIEVEKDERLLRHLMKQIALMPTANIMTLHSFCLKLLKSYYHKVDLDPGFRIGNETELILVQEEVLDELFEAQYEEAREEFIRLIEMFSYHKSDDALKSILLRMATMAR